MSDIIVAPYVTTTGSSLFTPTFVTMDEASSVCEASNEPTTIAGTRP